MCLTHVSDNHVMMNDESSIPPTYVLQDRHRKDNTCIMNSVVLWVMTYLEMMWW